MLPGPTTKGQIMRYYPAEQVRANYRYIQCSQELGFCNRKHVLEGHLTILEMRISVENGIVVTNFSLTGTQSQQHAKALHVAESSEVLHKQFLFVSVAGYAKSFSVMLARV